MPCQGVVFILIFSLWFSTLSLGEFLFLSRLVFATSICKMANLEPLWMKQSDLTWISTPRGSEPSGDLTSEPFGRMALGCQQEPSGDTMEEGLAGKLDRGKPFGETVLFVWRR